MIAVYLTDAPNGFGEKIAVNVIAGVLESAKNNRDSPCYKPKNHGRVVTQVETSYFLLRTR